MRRIDDKTFEIDNIDLPEIFNRRPVDTTKHDYGHALLIAGSYGMMGAAVLAARACLRSGVGMLTVHVPVCGVEIMQHAVPEAVLSIDDNDYYSTMLPDKLERYDAVAVGPGIGTEKKTARMLQDLLQRLQKRQKKQQRKPGSDDPANIALVMDADALNIMAANQRKFYRLLPTGTIITPHEWEYLRLFGQNHATEMARQYNLNIVKKEHHTRTYSFDGKVYINSTGNPGMATAGSGDVLTGIILSICAQKFPNDLAALLGVYLHGKSGDMAIKKQSQASLLASDIVENLKTVTL